MLRGTPAAHRRQNVAVVVLLALLGFLQFGRQMQFLDDEALATQFKCQIVGFWCVRGQRIQRG